MENHDHDHKEYEEESHDTAEFTNSIEDVNEHVGEHIHEPGFSVDELIEVMFGLEHVLAEVFWNSVWLGLAFVVGRIVAFRKVHKYIDDKHGVAHDKGDY